VGACVYFRPRFQSPSRRGQLRKGTAKIGQEPQVLVSVPFAKGTTS